MRRPSATGSTEVLLIGVYPSAWHVRWTPPECATHHFTRRGIGALAVDIEPEVFWDGADDDFTTEVSEWCRAVGFIEGDDPGQHGHIEQKSPPANGSSGAKIRPHYLDPVGVAIGRTAFTDIYPVFMVKHTAASRTQPTKRRQQGDAIMEEYDPLAGVMGKQIFTLPKRLSTRDLPHKAIENFGKKLLVEFVETKPALVISLGEEVWNALRMWPGMRAKHPAVSFRDLKGPRYGERGEIIGDGHAAQWLPLIHPGLLRQSLDVEAGRETGSWEDLHVRWESQIRAG
jgi:hypothetical protein